MKFGYRFEQNSNNIMQTYFILDHAFQKGFDKKSTIVHDCNYIDILNVIHGTVQFELLLPRVVRYTALPSFRWTNK